RASTTDGPAAPPPPHGARAGRAGVIARQESPMTDYENTTDVTASPDALFDYLADIGNLPEYFARMRSATLVGQGDAVHTVAELPDGQVVEGEAWFRVDRENRRIAWGSEGPSDYHGELAVSGTDGGARVWVKVSTARVESEQV